MVKLTPEVADAVVAAVADGLSLRHAAGVAGVAPQTVYNWMSRGRESRQGPYREFLDRVKNAQAEAVARNIACILDAAPKHWQAAAWWLERRYPEEFGQNRQELREMKKQIAELLDRMERLKAVDAG